MNKTVALKVISLVCENECIGPTRHQTERCFPCEIYTLAHAFSGCNSGCPTKHRGKEEVRKLAKEFGIKN